MNILKRFKEIPTRLKLYKMGMRMDRELAELINKLDYYKKLSKHDGQYYLLGTDSVRQKLLDARGTSEGRKYLLSLYQEWDDYGSIPLRLGIYLETLINNENISLGIHRISSYSLIDNTDVYHNPLLHNIFTDGLKNNGDLSSGVITSGIVQPSKTVSFFGSMLDVVIHVKTSYKGSKGGILVACPSSLVDRDGYIIDGKEKDVYNVVDNAVYLKPDFLLGYIAQDNGVCTYYSKDSFVKQAKQI